MSQGTSRGRFRIRCLGFGAVELGPEDTVRLGRHPTNDLVLADPTVSRFHATVSWPRDLPTARVQDNGSQNGTRVDGVELRGDARLLTARSSIEIGDYRFAARLNPSEATGGGPPAILTESDDLVTLFTDQGGEDMSGVLGRDASLREILLRAERERRTGTVELPDARGFVSVCLGRLIAASSDDAAGLPALEQLLRTSHGAYRFTREIEPTEEALDVWFSDYLLRGRTTRPVRRPRTA